MGNSNEVVSSPQEASQPSSAKISTLTSSLHVPSNSFLINSSYLDFSCNTISKARIIVRFFVFEDGIGFVQDTTNPLPNQEFELQAALNQRLAIRLNQAYINEYLYQPPSSLPIVIEGIAEN